MSFIRCTSNPENLYIWGGDEVHFSWSDPGEENNQQASCSYDDFYGLARLVIKDGEWPYIGDEDIVCGDLTLTHVDYCKVRKIEVKEDIFESWEKKEKGEADVHNYICLRIGDKNLYMYLVTWDYLLRSIIDHLKWQERESRLTYRMKQWFLFRWWDIREKSENPAENET